MYKKFDSASALEAWLQNPQIKKLYVVKFVNWTENKVIVEGKEMKVET